MFGRVSQITALL